MDFILDNNKLRTHILNNIGQDVIFAYYLGISAADIQYCLYNTSNKICNPLRVDHCPSIGFVYHNSKLYMKDWANDAYTGDIFHLVGLLHNKNCNSKKDFVKICYIIIENVVYHKLKDYTTINANVNLINYSTTKEQKLINIQRRDWKLIDSHYWTNKYGLNEATLLRNRIYPISKYWLDTTMYHCKDRVYAYYIDNINSIPIYKLYFVDRPKKSKYPRFITNGREPLEARWQLKKADNLIITKSRKDAVILRELINSSPFEKDLSIEVTNFSSESAKLSEKLLINIKCLYKCTYTLTDFDLSGVQCGNYHKKVGFIPMFLTNGRFGSINYAAKDISDYVESVGFDKAKELVINMLNKYI